MPKPSSTAPAGRPQPVPVGLFLASTREPGTRHSPRRSLAAVPGLPDWNGLSPAHLAYLIRHYTRIGDVVVDVDSHRSIIAAARYLHRTPARLTTIRTCLRVRLIPPAGQRTGRVRRSRPGADLILATLPRAEAYTLDLHGLTRAMNAWRSVLGPDGFLLTMLTTHRPEPGRISHRSTVIAAARAAGLLYHQHIPVVLVPLPEQELRTDPERANETGDGRRLLAGRHVPAFRDLLAFASTATGEETTGA